MDVSDTQSHDNLRRLRSNAFWELERSVEESGEGFIQRMREAEYMRSNNPFSHERGCPLRIPGSPARSPPPAYNAGLNISDEDDEDVQIYSGDASRFISMALQRNQSYDVSMDYEEMDHALPPTDISFNHAVSTPYAAWETSDTPGSSSPLSSPPRTPLQGAKAHPLPLQTFPVLPKSAPAEFPISASHCFGSEKDVDELSLALANGAGGINDYYAARQGTIGEVDSCDAGDLWR